VLNSLSCRLSQVIVQSYMFVTCAHFIFFSDNSCLPLHCWSNSFDFMFLLVSHLFIYYMFRSPNVVHISFYLLKISAAIEHCSISEEKATFSLLQLEKSVIWRTGWYRWSIIPPLRNASFYEELAVLHDHQQEEHFLLKFIYFHT